MPERRILSLKNSRPCYDLNPGTPGTKPICYQLSYSGLDFWYILYNFFFFIFFSHIFIDSHVRDTVKYFDAKTLKNFIFTTSNVNNKIFSQKKLNRSNFDIHFFVICMTELSFVTIYLILNFGDVFCNIHWGRGTFKESISCVNLCVNLNSVPK